MAKARSSDDIPDLGKCLMKLIRQVPSGRVTTYGALAAALGNSAAARWVGQFLRHHPHDASCFCHRVVYRDGTLGEFVTSDRQAKAALLQAEGVRFVPPRPVRGSAGAEPESLMIDLAEYGFREEEFVGDRPLMRLRGLQNALAGNVVLEPFGQPPELVGGLDISYPSPDEGRSGLHARRVALGPAGLVAHGPPAGTVSLHSHVPDIPRTADPPGTIGRGPVGRKTSPHWCWSTARAFCIRIGSASPVTWEWLPGVPTIGVTKKLLCGSVALEGFEPQESRPVRHQGEVVGVAIRPTAGSRRPIFVSPGHRIDLVGAETIVRGVLQGRRLPEPLFWADRISREEGKRG